MKNKLPVLSFIGLVAVVSTATLAGRAGNAPSAASTPSPAGKGCCAMTNREVFVQPAGEDAAAADGKHCHLEAPAPQKPAAAPPRSCCR